MYDIYCSVIDTVSRNVLDGCGIGESGCFCFSRYL